MPDRPHVEGRDTNPPDGVPLVKNALQGVAWNWTGGGILIVAQIVSTAATARLVSPREFGLYAVAQAASVIAGYFCMRAVAQGLQRRTRLGPKTVSTASAITLASSFAVALCLWFGGSLWATLWGLPDAAWVVRVTGITLFLWSAATVPLALIRRELKFGKAAVIETSTIVSGMFIGVALAIPLHSALALAFGQLAGAAILLIATAIANESRLRISFDWGDARELLVFASQVGGLGFVSYFTTTLPSLFISRTFGASTLGLYSRARLLAELPTEYAVTSIYKVVYPLYGRVRDNSAKVRTLLYESLTLTTGVVWPAFAFAAGAAPLLITTLLGSRWASAAPLFAYSALGACALIPGGLLTNCAEALGWMRMIAVRQMVFLGGVLSIIAVVHFAGWGLKGLLLGLAGVQWMTYLITLSPFARRHLLDGRTVILDQGVHAVVALVVYGAAAACINVTKASGVGLQLAIIVVLGAMVSGTLIVCHAWFPAGRILSKRIMQVAPGWSGVRIGRFRPFFW